MDGFRREVKTILKGKTHDTLEFELILNQNNNDKNNVDKKVS